MQWQRRAGEWPRWQSRGLGANGERRAEDPATVAPAQAIPGLRAILPQFSRRCRIPAGFLRGKASAREAPDGTRAHPLFLDSPCCAGTGLAAADEARRDALRRLFPRCSRKSILSSNGDYNRAEVSEWAEGEEAEEPEALFRRNRASQVYRFRRARRRH